jgi:hypothetical protein
MLLRRIAGDTADIVFQNAMNAAEITDKLGLHSLRQRAWVSSIADLCIDHVLTNPTVHPVDLRYIR